MEALSTEGKTPKRKCFPNDLWKKNILLAEHSPIRTLEFRIEWPQIKYWVAMHLRTHQVGTWHPDDLVFISTQRDDRTADTTSRNEKRQDELVKMVMRLNAQSIINISRKRYCSKAAPETREAWLAVVRKLAEIDPVLAEVCVPECLYRGFCPERDSCGYVNTASFINALLKYRCGGYDGRKEMQRTKDERPQQKVCTVQERESSTQEQGTKASSTQKKSRKRSRPKRNTLKSPTSGDGKAQGEQLSVEKTDRYTEHQAPK